MTIATATNLLPGGKTTVGPGSAFEAPINKTLQVAVAGAGAVSATVVIEGSVLGGDAWVALATFPLSGTGAAVDGVVSDAPWPLIRANVTAISGTGATVSAGMGG